MATITKEKNKAKDLLKHLQQKELMLYNDDVNTFEHVIKCLMKVCGHTAVQAEQCAYIVHYNGKCVVKKGYIEKLKYMYEALRDEKLSVKII